MPSLGLAISHGCFSLKRLMERSGLFKRGASLAGFPGVALVKKVLKGAAVE